jgi:hypothetical protein
MAQTKLTYDKGGATAQLGSRQAPVEIVVRDLRAQFE